MNEITKYVTIDLSRNQAQRMVFAKQLDHLGRRIEITLTDNGKEYAVPSGAVATLNIQRPDGESGRFGVEITEKGRLLVTLTAWMLEKSGEVGCTVALYFSGEMKLSTPKFILEVGEEITSENEIDSESHSLLTSLLSDYAEVAEAEEQRAQAESRRTLYENQRLQGEYARQSNELSRIEGESTRVDGESTRINNENARIEGENARIEGENERIAAEEDRQGVMGNLVEALEGINKLVSDEVKTALSVAYPVGSVYVSFEDTSPAVLFGGAWEELDDGRFLMANKATSGATGGAEEHCHEVDGWAYWVCNAYSGTMRWREKMFNDAENKRMDRCYVGSEASSFDEAFEVYGVSVDGYAHNESSLPPYVTVHMWRRTA